MKPCYYIVGRRTSCVDSFVDIALYDDMRTATKWCLSKLGEEKLTVEPPMENIDTSENLPDNFVVTITGETIQFRIHKIPLITKRDNDRAIAREHVLTVLDIYGFMPELFDVDGLIIDKLDECFHENLTYLMYFHWWNIAKKALNDGDVRGAREICQKHNFDFDKLKSK